MKYLTSKEINNSEIIIMNFLKIGFESDKINKDEYNQLVLFFNEQKQKETKIELKYISINNGRFINKNSEGR